MKWTQGWQNIRNTPDLPRAQVRRCARIMKREHVDAASFCEIAEGGQDAHDVREGLTGFFRMVCRRTNAPHAFSRRKFRLVWANRILANEGDRDVPIGRRFLTEVCLRPRLALRPPKVVWLSIHHVAGAWNGKDPSRQPLWHDQDDLLRSRVDHYLALGYTVVICMDANRVKIPKYHPAQVEVWGDGGIDKMIVIPAHGYHVKVLRKWRENTPSDHHAIFARLWLRRVP